MTWIQKQDSDLCRRFRVTWAYRRSWRIRSAHPHGHPHAAGCVQSL